MPLPAPVTQTILFSKGCTHPLPRQSIDNPLPRQRPVDESLSPLSVLAPPKHRHVTVGAYYKRAVRRLEQEATMPAAAIAKLALRRSNSARHENRPDPNPPIFLINSILCIKEGAMNATIRASWVTLVRNGIFGL
jgi:hypothetical protein